VRVPAGAVVLEADLAIPDRPTGVVLFAHGSGSSRHSSRNRLVAARLQEVGLVTVLADLLTSSEERLDEFTGRLRFDIRLLADRVVGVMDWLPDRPDIAGLPAGLFGASTGAAAALEAAARRPGAVQAVVSRGGRPDLVGAALSRVRAPTLLIVGGRDLAVLEVNRQAAEALAGEGELRTVPDATHLFPEPGALEQVAVWAGEWFTRHLSAPGPDPVLT
jgi:pimeloyl-ACP methyl ester carboxylesterase